MNKIAVPDEFVSIGKVIGAHGIRGAVKVYAEAASVDIYAKGLAVLLGDGKDGAEKYTIQWCEPYKKGFRIAFKGVCDRSAAEGLVGTEIYIPKDQLPSLEKDTYYWSDLIGLAVYDISVGCLGQIASIMPTAGHDVYVVKDPAKGADYEVRIPALASVVTDVDLERRKMQVDVPEGLVPNLLNPGA